MSSIGYEDFHQTLLEKIIPEPMSINEISIKSKVLDLTGSIGKKNRQGIVTGVGEKYINIKYFDYDLTTELRFYGNTWGLLKDE